MKDDIELLDVNMDETDSKSVSRTVNAPERKKRVASQNNNIQQKKKEQSQKSVKKPKKENKPLKIVLRVLLCIVTFIAITFAGAYMTLWTICHGPSKAARDLFVSTILETGQMKFLASWYFSEDEILAITNRNGMARTEDNVNTHRGSDRAAYPPSRPGYNTTAARHTPLSKPGRSDSIRPCRND